MHHPDWDSTFDPAANWHEGDPLDHHPAHDPASPLGDAWLGLDQHHHQGSDPGAEHEVEATRQYYGTPVEDLHQWEHQTTPFTCAVEAQRGVIEACTGQHFSEAELAAEAAEHGWLHTRFSDEGAGTQVCDVGKLLELHGIETHRAEDASMGDLMSELAAGHKVIVGVNSSDLWYPDSVQSFLHQGADHAIWVTGVDTSDPDHVKVIINDSGDPHGAGKSYDLDQFMDAWEDSGHFYVATDKAPPDLHVTAPGFNEEQGLFTDIVDWAHDHALPLAIGGVALAATGVALSDLMGKGRLSDTSKSLREKLKQRYGRYPDDPDLIPEN